MSLQDPIAPLLIAATNDAYRDPAFAGLGETDLAEYRSARDLEPLKPALAGVPTLFECKRLPPVAAVALDSMTGAFRLLIAFKLGCHKVTLPDGAVLEPNAKQLTNGPGGAKQADDEWFNACASRFGLETCYEVANVVHQFARLRAADRGPFTY